MDSDELLAEMEILYSLIDIKERYGLSKTKLKDIVDQVFLEGFKDEGDE